MFDNACKDVRPRGKNGRGQIWLLLTWGFVKKVCQNFFHIIRKCAKIRLSFKRKLQISQSCSPSISCGYVFKKIVAIVGYSFEWRNFYILLNNLAFIFTKLIMFSLHILTWVKYGGDFLNAFYMWDMIMIALNFLLIENVLY